MRLLWWLLLASATGVEVDVALWSQTRPTVLSLQADGGAKARLSRGIHRKRPVVAQPDSHAEDKELQPIVIAAPKVEHNVAGALIHWHNTSPNQ